MSIYALEIDGQAICAFNAADADEANARIHEEYLRSDLMVLAHADDGPLWDGESALEFRLALPDEAETFQRSLVRALSEGENDEDWLCFLVPIRDPTDEVSDEE